MANILDYLDWRGDITLRERPFNEIDNLILSCLAYLQMTDLVPGPGGKETVPLADLPARYERAGYDQSYLVNDALPLLKKAAVSRRFGNVRAGAYVDIVDAEKQLQFSAVTWYLDDDTIYAAYRGTDNTIVGWREDFNLSYMAETPGQQEAVRYLDRMAEETACPIRVGGHSKGGNLAVYAAAFCGAEARARLLTAYSNDGPGFNSAISLTEPYQSVLDKVDLIVPESSVIGILLSNKSDKRIVKSTASGPQQHDPYTWLVRGTEFETADALSVSSVFMDETLDRWIGEMSDDQREQLVSVIFDSMNAAGAATLHELNARKWSSYAAILRAVLKTDPVRRGSVLDALRKLAAAGSETAQADARQILASLWND